MKTIGLIGGMSWESTAVYYQLINNLVRERRGGLHSAKIVMWSVDFAPIAEMQSRGAWDAAGETLADTGRALERAGAECLLICTNTMHIIAERVRNGVGIPLLHIADATAAAITEKHATNPLLLATRFTMEGDFYRGYLRDKHGIATLVPGPEDRTRVHDIIYDELCRGIINSGSREVYQGIIEEAVKDGADSVIFGCTEVGLLLSQQDVPVPVFDTTALHVEEAVRFALS